MYISKENQRLGIKLFKQRTLLTEKLSPKNVYAFSNVILKQFSNIFFNYSSIQF